MGNRIQRAYGVGAPFINVFPIPVDAKRAPINGQDTDYPQGQNWWDNSQPSPVQYVFNGQGQWLTEATGALNTLSDDANTQVAPVGGNIKIEGTTNQIETAAGAGTIQIELSPTLVAPGSITAASGNITATAGNFVSSTIGNGIVLASVTGSGASPGPVTVNGRSGTVIFTGASIAPGADLALTLTNSAITSASTIVMYSMRGATLGAALSVESVVNSAGSSVITVTNGTGATAQSTNLSFDFLVIN
ncbi:MAG TPA: hypothetical protein VIJ14_07925 [Rhabdochlamydiaceae bacterium]